MGYGRGNQLQWPGEKEMSLVGNQAFAKQYEELLAQEGVALARLVAGYVSNSAEQEDLGQDIALALWKALPHFRGESSLRTFTYRVAHNRCINFICRRKPQAQSEEIEFVQGDDCVHGKAVAAERRIILQQAIRKLPLDYRQLVMLALEELPYAEIAAIVGITENNVSVKLNRAKAMLKKKLGELS